MLSENFESRAAIAEDTLSRVPESFLCMADVQQYVRMWEQSHILATFVLGDTLLECVVRSRHAGQFTMFISPMNWHPSLVKVLIDDKGYLLNDQLSKVHKLWMNQSHAKESEGKSVREWVYYCNQMIMKGKS